ncbi:MFS transporter [Gordonia sp. DT219]|uniref:MFS transporter n=1 Tax=Gordonia sp. DT219 TaxID=3416658 RepID=UPI003CF33887
MTETSSTHISSPQTSTPGAPSAVIGGSGAVLAVLLTAQFMALVDGTIVNVAAPDIQRSMGASTAQVQLIVSGYVITYAAGLITGARLGDRFGHSRVMRAGLAIFTVASLACGLAADPGQLFAFRLLQGVGGALMMPQVMSLIQRTFVGSARTRALGLYAVVTATGAVAGQIIGGVLITADIGHTGWRPTMLINVPIGAALWAILRIKRSGESGDPERTIDLTGAALGGGSLSALVVPLILGRESGWPAWTWISLVGAACLAAAFVVVERRVERAGGVPMIAASVVRSRGMIPAVLTLVIVFACYAGCLLSTSIHFQTGLGESALSGGIRFLPLAIGFSLAGLSWQRLPAAHHSTVVVVGAATTAVAFFTLAWSFGNGADIATEAAFALLGLGMGFAFSPVISVTLARVPLRFAADASGILSTSFQVGNVLGIALFGSIYLSAAQRFTSSHAMSITSWTLGAASIAAGVAALGVVGATISADRVAGAPATYRAECEEPDL